MTRLRPTNGYEARRQQYLAEVASTKIKAAAAASAIALVQTKLAAGQSTDGAVFFATDGKPLGGKLPGMVVLHQTSQTSLRDPVGLDGRETVHIALHLVRRGYVCVAPRNFLWAFEVVMNGNFRTEALAAINWILFSLLRARVIKVAVLEIRHGLVGLFDVSEHLCVE